MQRRGYGVAFLEVTWFKSIIYLEVLMTKRYLVLFLFSFVALTLNAQAFFEETGKRKVNVGGTEYEIIQYQFSGEALKQEKRKAKEMEKALRKERRKAKKARARKRARLNELEFQQEMLLQKSAHNDFENRNNPRLREEERSRIWNERVRIEEEIQAERRRLRRKK